MKLKESTFKLLSLLFIIIFTYNTSFTQRIDTDVGDNGMYYTTESNYQYVLNYENTFLCFSNNSLTFYDEPGEPDYETYGEFDYLFNVEKDYLIAKIDINNNEANFLGCVQNPDSEKLEFAHAKIDLDAKDYVHSFAKFGVFINNSSEENEELIGSLELEDRTLLYGYRGSSAVLMEIDKNGKKLKNSAGNEDIVLNDGTNLRFLHILENDEIRYYFIQRYSIESSSVYLIKLDKEETITQEIYDAEKVLLNYFPAYSIFDSYDLQAKIIGNHFIIAFDYWCERGAYVLNLDDYSGKDLNLDKLELNYTLKNTHILDDGTILVTGILDKEYAHRLFVYALNPEGELKSDFGIGGFYFLEIGEFSEVLELNNTYYNNGKLIFSISDVLKGNYFIPVVFDELVKAPERKLVEFTFYPNPTLNSIKIASENLKQVSEFRIFDESGKMLVREDHDMNPELIINVSRFNSANYIISFYSGTKLIGSQKFVKI